MKRSNKQRDIKQRSSKQRDIKQRDRKRKQRQYGGELTNDDKIALANALRAVTFENGDGAIDEDIINDIIAHLETLSGYDSNNNSNNIEQFISQIRVPFVSMADFNDWIADTEDYYPPERQMEMEKDNNVLEATSFEDKTKLNGGKKRKTRKLRKKKRKTRKMCSV